MPRPTQMNDRLEITTTQGPIRGQVRPPGSKSITNRALVCAALADGISVLTGALDSEDTRVMIAALRKLGIAVESRDGSRTLTITGTAGDIPVLEADLCCANSGTTMRFLASMVAIGHGAFHLDGIQRMRERPIGDLLDALGQLGVTAISENGDSCPPIMVHANGLPGGTATVRGDISSQFLSGLLMAAPRAMKAVEITVADALVSQPYVRMTIDLMHAFGVNVISTSRLDHFTIAAPQVYSAREIAIEPDASSASYFWASAAITEGRVTVTGLHEQSLQGDVAYVDALARMGCEIVRDAAGLTVIGRPLRGIDIDMNAISDTVQTLAVVALFAQGPTTIRGVAHIRHKETDRIGNLAIELRKLGATIEEHQDGLTIHPGVPHGADMETYNDHRMAMSLSLAGLKVPGVAILNPECTDKTYPGFFRDLQSLVANSTE